jgi:transcription elongation factor Elf1
MSEGWKNGYWALFKCPLCGSTKYVEVRAKKPNGHWYTTDFYECVHCTVMFHDPVSFARCRVPGVQKPTESTWGSGAAAYEVKPSGSTEPD